MTGDFTITAIAPIGVDVQWLCKVERPGLVGTAYAALSGLDLHLTDPAKIEALKAERIEQAKRALVERV